MQLHMKYWTATAPEVSFIVRKDKFKVSDGLMTKALKFAVGRGFKKRCMAPVIAEGADVMIHAWQTQDSRCQGAQFHFVNPRGTY